MNIGHCGWAFANEMTRVYHDTEWGIPVHDDRQMFEHLMADITADNVPTLNSLHNLSAVTAMIAGTNLEGWARFTALPRSISKLSAISILINCMRFLSSSKSDIAGRM